MKYVYDVFLKHFYYFDLILAYLIFSLPSPEYMNIILIFYIEQIRQHLWLYCLFFCYFFYLCKVTCNLLNLNFDLCKKNWKSLNYWFGDIQKIESFRIMVLMILCCCVTNNFLSLQKVNNYIYYISISLNIFDCSSFIHCLV